MTKTEKKAQLKTMIAEFMKTTDPAEMKRICDGIFKEVSKLPMSTHDRNHTEDEMDLWIYNTDRYIQNPKSTPAHTSVVADFEEIIRTVDVSLLGN